MLYTNVFFTRDRWGNTAMHLAAKEGYVNTVQAILNVHGYLLNAANKVGVSFGYPMRGEIRQT